MTTYPYKLYLVFLLLIIPFLGYSQFRYNIPTHYQGIFDLQRTPVKQAIKKIAVAKPEG